MAGVELLHHRMVTLSSALGSAGIQKAGLVAAGSDRAHRPEDRMDCSMQGLWSPEVSLWPLWSPMVSLGLPWFPVVSPLAPVVSHGLLWSPVVSHVAQLCGPPLS